MSTTCVPDVIVPIYSLSKRSYDRVRYSCASLRESRSRVNYVRLIVGGDRHEFKRVNEVTRGIDGLNIVHKPLKKFNKCILLNCGISLSLNYGAEWIMCADVDNLYHPNFMTLCEQHRAVDKMLLKEIQMMDANAKIKISPWEMNGKFPFNIWKRKACGAIAYAHRSFWLENKYDERLEGMGYMDTYIVELAKKRGLSIEWLVGEGLLLHQHHKPIHRGRSISHKRNSKIVEDMKSA